MREGAEIIALAPRPQAEPWLSKRQIARHYGRSTRWIELRMREGLPSRLLGGHRAFRLSEVDALDGRALLVIVEALGRHLRDAEGGTRS